MATTTPDINMFMHLEKNDYLKKCQKAQYRHLGAYIGPPGLVH